MALERFQDLEKAKIASGDLFQLILKLFPNDLTKIIIPYYLSMEYFKYLEYEDFFAAAGLITSFFKRIEQDLVTRDRAGVTDEWSQLLAAVQEEKDTMIFRPIGAMLKKHSKAMELFPVNISLDTHSVLKSYARKFLNLRELDVQSIDKTVRQAMADMFYWVYLNNEEMIPVELTQAQIDLLLNNWKKDTNKETASVSIDNIIQALSYYGLQDEFIVLDNAELDPDVKGIKNTKVVLIDAKNQKKLPNVLQGTETYILNKSLVFALEEAAKLSPSIEGADERLIAALHALGLKDQYKIEGYNGFDGYVVKLTRKARCEINQILRNKLLSIAPSITCDGLQSYAYSKLSGITDRALVDGINEYINIKDEFTHSNFSMNFLDPLISRLLEAIKANKYPQDKDKLIKLLFNANQLWDATYNLFKTRFISEGDKFKRPRIFNSESFLFFHSLALRDDKTPNKDSLKTLLLDDQTTPESSAKKLLTGLGLDVKDENLTSNPKDEKGFGFIAMLTISQAEALNDKLRNFIIKQMPQSDIIKPNPAETKLRTQLSKRIIALDFGYDKSFEDVVTTLDALYKCTQKEEYSELSYTIKSKLFSDTRQHYADQVDDITPIIMLG